MLLMATVVERHLVMLVAAAYLGVSSYCTSCHFIVFLSSQWTKPHKYR